MSEQITYYHDTLKLSPFCHRVEIALLEAGASYTALGFDIYNKPAWFAQVNPSTGKIPAITYGGPNVAPEEPSPLSFKLTESYVLLEFLADIFPNSNLLPTNPIARARVRFFMDIAVRAVEAPITELFRGSGSIDKIIEGLEKIQVLLPDPDAADGGEFAIGKDFTNADCAFVPLLSVLEIIGKTDLGKFQPGLGKKLAEELAGDKFERLRQYKKAVWARESVQKVIDLDRIESGWRTRFSRE
ncbi:hypothetical protein JVU11DRAFT_8147 [Chiua virens]|nr:hypothetical protein JVU11DRAFT_8147 [Chiua virens]